MLSGTEKLGYLGIQKKYQQQTNSNLKYRGRILHDIIICKLHRHRINRNDFKGLIHFNSLQRIKLR